MECRDGGVCHHNCQKACFREECCEPLTLSNLNLNWTPKTRLVLRYRGHVIKLWHNSTIHLSKLDGWTVECKIDGEFIGTSFCSFAAAMRTAKDSIDHAIEQAPIIKIARRTHSFVKLQAVIRRLSQPKTFNALRFK